MNKDIPCCQADAVRKTRMVSVNGIQTGITMLDEIVTEVKELNLSSDQQIKENLLRRVKVYNYIPKPVEEAYLTSIFTIYQKGSQE
ncbi:MAG: hypothetical protein LUQ50_04280 [Methanospirillum sp.]|uniref:hypothetical protein n=1 Tax=Methanospirillum sp. TaxID=45200 RepID=UPI00236EE25D|nr:hypothetical protein [Methanospirillum sp.]MDD1728274.1 hypothetical protein [Methanospirillum sp.]